jgi:hypothetical protein
MAVRRFIRNIPVGWDRAFAEGMTQNKGIDVSVVAHLFAPSSPSDSWDINLLDNPYWKAPEGAVFMWRNNNNILQYEAWGYQRVEARGLSPAYTLAPSQLPFETHQIMVAISTWQKRGA